MDEVGFDEYVSGEGVSLIEWANLIEEILPENRVNITIEKDLEQGFDFRRITIEEQQRKEGKVTYESIGNRQFRVNCDRRDR